MPSKSKLSAIMFTDIVGYSGMMEQDENRTMQVLEEHNSIIFPLIESYEGRIVDTIGDGILAVFDSALSAANCGIQIQSSIKNYNSEQTGNLQFYVRIGIHLGDIWFNEDRIYGNDVNITSRILPFSLPGGICVSDSVFKQLSAKLSLETEDLGRKKLKNIAAPVQVHRLILGTENTDVDQKGEKDRDDIRDIILKEKAKLKDQRHDADEPKSKFESKIYNFVDHVMDKALDKWDEMPEEKKNKAIQQVRSGNGSKQIITVESGKNSKHKHDEDDEEGYELLGVGIVSSLGFGGAMYYWGSFWLIWPLIFIGLIPLSIGIGRFVRAAVKNKKMRTSLPEEREKRIIKAASESNGMLSVMQLASNAGITLDEAQRDLDIMVKKGYIGQELDEKGILRYTFPEFLTDESSKE